MDDKGKILTFKKGKDVYTALADKKAEQGDLVASLGFLFSALEKNGDYTILADIADTYSEMGLMSLSNAYWFKFLEKAPENKLTVAYEQLAINYFYMDNYFVASYYFHLKLSKDGYISKEGLDEEVLNFFYDTFDKKSAYHVAYPPDKADWSFRKKMAKHALAAGDSENAEKIYSSIPKECMDEDTYGEFAVTLFLNKKDKQLIQACKDSLETHGENVTAYCNLSSLYHDKGDKEKSEYYYAKALSLNNGELNHAYKIATCAMEQKDHETACSALAKILQERAYDVNMNFFYAIALANTGNIEGATQIFCQIYRIYPSDKVVEFYAKYFTWLSDGAPDEKGILPLDYARELPSKMVKNYKRKISELFGDLKKASSQIKRQEVREVLEWGITQERGEYGKNSVFILANSESEWAEKLLIDSLMNIDVCPSVKRAIITMLILKGYRQRFNVIANDFFVTVKPRKLVCENKLDGDLFVAAYATCLSRMAFWNIEGFDKIAFSINKLYKKLGNSVYFTGITPEEIGAIAVCISKFERLDNPDYVCKFFDARVNVVKEHLAMLKGEKHD